MSSLVKARQMLAGINALLKQGKHMAAAQTIHNALQIMLKESLMKSEKEEFANLLEKAIFQLNQDKGLRKIYPLILHYAPGDEAGLLATVREMLQELQNHYNEELKQDVELLKKRKLEGLAAGQKLLDAGKFEEAKRFFDKFLLEFKSDTELKADVADRFLKAGRYQEAFNYLDEALRNDPGAHFLYNRIGIVLRKMKQFETAEKYYQKALEVAKADEYLFFNLGRLYHDWGRWDRMEKAAERALKVNPKFGEAEKMRQFALKKQGKC